MLAKTHAFSVDSNGIVSLWLQSDAVGTIVATASLSVDADENDSGRYSFVPFKFDINSGYIPAVAGKPTDITITAKSCSDTDGANKDKIAVGYEGNRTLKLSDGLHCTKPRAEQQQ